MPFMTRPADLTNVIYRGLVVLGCISAPVTATAYVPRDMGALGVTYSLRMGMDNFDQMPGKPFASSSAVPDTTLARISGNGNSGSDAHTPVLGIPGVKPAARGTPGGSYGYARDIESQLWWAFFLPESS